MLDACVASFSLDYSSTCSTSRLVASTWTTSALDASIVAHSTRRLSTSRLVASTCRRGWRPQPQSNRSRGRRHRHECIRAGPPTGVALPKSIAEPYSDQTSIHPLWSDDFPRLIGRGPGDGRHRDRAEPGEMSVHPRGVGQSHPDPSLQHQASQVPTNGERFRATPNLPLKVGETQVCVVGNM